VSERQIYQLCLIAGAQELCAIDGAKAAPTSFLVVGRPERCILHDAWTENNSDPACDSVLPVECLPCGGEPVYDSMQLASGVPLVVHAYRPDTESEEEEEEAAGPDGDKGLANPQPGGALPSQASRYIVMRRESYAQLQMASERSIKQAQYLHVLYEKLRDGILVIDLRGTIIYANPAAARLFGRRVADLADAPFGFPISGGSATEICLHPPSGGECIAEMNVVPIIWNKQSAWLCSLHDVTERKRVDRLKSEFISIVSHELRTPVTSILGALMLVGSGATGELPTKTAEMIQIAQRNSERLSHLINDILDIERIESGNVQFVPEQFDLMRLVEEAVETNGEYASMAGIDLEIAKAEQDVQVRVDRFRFLQIMANLLSNAVKFSPRWGKVEISVTRDNRAARVSVRDHGCGIPAEFRARIFHKFAQADVTDTRSRTGTGLGLSICKAIAEKMNGKIGFESKVGEGSVFYVDLPLASPPNKVAPDAAQS
jgi:signal transduction histidine kinase